MRELSDPDIINILHADEVPVGLRTSSVFRVMHALGEAGATNHEILTVARDLGRRWGKFPDSNLYYQWYTLLAMLRKVRAKYPYKGNSDEVEE